MTEKQTRRALLAGVATVAVAGCSSLVSTHADSNDGMATPDDPDNPESTATPDGTETLPEDCPKTQNLDVEWPEELTAETVRSFVEEYENTYYREEVVEFEKKSRLDEYGLSAGIMEGPREADDGFELTVTGSGGVYRPTLHLGATPAEAPTDADVVALDAVENETLRTVLSDAAADGEAEHHIDEPGERVDQFIDLVASLSESFDPPESVSESGTAHFDVDGTTVELSVTANSFHGDYWWGARYYVDEHVIWRVGKQGGGEVETDPREGKLLECRNSA